MHTDRMADACCVDRMADACCIDACVYMCIFFFLLQTRYETRAVLLFSAVDKGSCPWAIPSFSPRL
jgi:hypothetical protein